MRIFNAGLFSASYVFVLMLSATYVPLYPNFPGILLCLLRILNNHH